MDAGASSKCVNSLFLITITGVLFFTGCAQVHRFSDPDLYEAAYTRINNRAERGTAVLTMRSRMRIPARGLKMAQDSSFWTDHATGTSRHTATSEIVRVEFLERRPGAVDGFWVGAATGALLVFGSSLGSGYSLGNSLVNVFAYGIYIVPVTGAVGALFGFAIGKYEYYSFTQEDGPAAKRRHKPMR